MSQAILDEPIIEERVAARPNRMLRGAIWVAIPSALLLAHRLIEFLLEHPLWSGQLWKVPVSIGDAMLKFAFAGSVIAAVRVLCDGPRRAAPMRIAVAYAAIVIGGFIWYVASYWRGMGAENWFYVDIALDVATNVCLGLLAVCSWEVSRRCTRGRWLITGATAICIVSFFAAIAFMFWWDGLQIYAAHARLQDGALPRIVRWFDQNPEFDAPFHLARLAAQSAFWILIVIAAAFPRRAEGGVRD